MFWYGDYYRSQIYAFPDWNLSKLKFFNEGLSSKSDNISAKFFSSHYPFAFHNKNLAKKLSDFDEILTSKSTQMVFLVVKFLSKSDNFLAKFLNFLKNSQSKDFNFGKF